MLDINAKVKCTGNRYSGTQLAEVGQIYTVKKLYDKDYQGGGMFYELYTPEGASIERYAYESDLSYLITNNNYNNMNALQKFALSLKKEPQKSFIKAGITDNDNMLTADGTKIFLSWLLETKHATDFKAEVVDALLAEDEKKA